MKTRPATIHAVGVDLGGTWLRVCALDRRGRVIREAKQPAPPPPYLAKALILLWKKWGLARAPLLLVGSKGVWKQNPRRRMSAALAPLAGNVTVLSDVELAYRSVVGEGAGVLILAGTGSIALGRDGRGRWIRAGGLGPKSGDEGSGFWIGRKYLKRTGKKVPSPTPEGVRRTAEAAENVLNRAPRDPLSAEILQEAQGHLVMILREVLGKLSLGKEGRVGWSGGLFKNDGFRRGFFRRLRKSEPGTSFRTASPRFPAQRAAGLLALRLWRAEGSPPILERVQGGF